MMLWRDDEVSSARVHEAREHARAGYAYLAGPAVSGCIDEESAVLLPVARTRGEERERAGDRGFVLLPLVLDGHRVFGVLQVDSAVRLDETDLMFFDALVGQLAIALDRLAVVRARQAEAEGRRMLAESAAALARSAEQAQRMLSETSERLADAPDELTVHAIVAHAAVAHLADLCVLDAIADDGRGVVEIVVADPAITPMVDLVRTRAPAGIAEESRLFTDLAETESMMVVPMTARGRTLGAITFASVSGRRYGLADLALAEDLAHRAALAIDNLRLHAQAQRAVRARDEILAIVSHDLKNPLNHIMLSAGALKEALAQSDSPGSRWLDAIQHASGRMDRIIMDLLDTASIAAGRMVVTIREQGVAQLVADAIEAHEGLAAQHSLRLEHGHVDDTLAFDCDHGRVLQVLGNLLGNAIKFTPPGGRVALDVALCGDDLLFSVSDTGPGIAPDELPHVFDRYWQSAKTAHLGTGLGLSIARALVEAHGGRIWAESQLGHGTTFFFTIPRRATLRVG